MVRHRSLAVGGAAGVEGGPSPHPPPAHLGTGARSPGTRIVTLLLVMADTTHLDALQLESAAVGTPSAARPPGYVEFDKRRDGMIHAMEGGLWLHRHVWMGRPMAHLVSTDRQRLLAYGRAVGLPPDRLQFKPLKDPRTGERREAWHWDLVGRFLPPP